MTAVTISINDGAVLDALTRMGIALDNLEVPFNDIGDLLQNSVLLNFFEQHDPDGNPWAPLSEVTIKNRRQNGVGGVEILRDMGMLNRSITCNADRYGVEVGTDKVYGNLQQFGGTKAAFPHLWGDIPARPFVGISEEDKVGILHILANFIEQKANSL
jgi:phage virion morphogenesis protein